MVRYISLSLVLLALGCDTSPKPQEGKPVVMAAAAPTVQGAAVNGPTAYWSYVNVEGQKATYGYVITQLALVAGANFGVVGSATKTIKVTHVKVGPSFSTDGGIQDMSFRIYNTLPGDAAFYFLFPPYQYDPDGGVPATGQVIWYDLAATGGTLAAALRTEELLSTPIASFSSIGNTLVWDFCNGRPEGCPTIRGVNQTGLLFLAAGGALAGQKADVEIGWTEE